MRTRSRVLSLLVFGLAPGLAHAQALDLQVKADAANGGVTSQTDVVTQVQSLQTRVELGLQTGSSAAAAPLAGSGWWNSGKLDVGATWAPTALAKLDLSANNSMRLEFDPSDPVFADAAERTREARTSEARGALTFTPLSPLNLQVGAAVSGSYLQNTEVSGAGVATSDLLQTQAQQIFSSVQWKPLGQISLEGGGKLESTGVYWAGARAGSFAALDPRVGATVTPWSGAAVHLSLERAAAPLSTDQFIGFETAAAGDASLMTLQPNREWRYQASVEQKAGPIALSASVLHATLQSFAYVAPYGADSGRVDMGEGQRSEVQAAVATPIALMGLLPLTVKASGAWRSSAAADPLTGTVGRLSGERPYDASLSLTQAASSWNMRWGMTAMATGPERDYLASQTTTRSATAGLGGFLEYHPGVVTLQLQLDNILGGDRLEHDVYYAGARDLNVIDRMDDSRFTDRAVRLSLIRPL